MHLTVPPEQGPVGMRITNDVTIPGWRAWRWHVGLAPLEGQDALLYRQEQERHQIERFLLQAEVQRTGQVFVEDSGLLRDVAAETSENGTRLIEAISENEPDRAVVDHLVAAAASLNDKFNEFAMRERRSSRLYAEARDRLRVYDDEGPEADAQALTGPTQHDAQTGD